MHAIKVERLGSHWVARSDGLGGQARRLTVEEIQCYGKNYIPEELP